MSSQFHNSLPCVLYIWSGGRAVRGQFQHEWDRGKACDLLCTLTRLHHNLCGGKLNKKNSQQRHLHNETFIPVLISMVKRILSRVCHHLIYTDNMSVFIYIKKTQRILCLLMLFVLPFFLSLAILVFNFYWGPTADNLSAIMCFYFILFLYLLYYCLSARDAVLLLR